MTRVSKGTVVDPLTRIANQIIAKKGLSPHDVGPKALSNLTLYEALRRHVQPFIEPLSLVDAAGLAARGRGISDEALMAYIRQGHKPNLGDRVLLIEAHGWSLRWRSPGLDGQATIFLTACTAVIARIFDILKGNRVLLAPFPTQRDARAN